MVGLEPTAYKKFTSDSFQIFASTPWANQADNYNDQ